MNNRPLLQQLIQQDLRVSMQVIIIPAEQGIYKGVFEKFKIIRHSKKYYGPYKLDQFLRTNELYLPD